MSQTNGRAKGESIDQIMQGLEVIAQDLTQKVAELRMGIGMLRQLRRQEQEQERAERADAHCALKEWR